MSVLPILGELWSETGLQSRLALAPNIPLLVAAVAQTHLSIRSNAISAQQQIGQEIRQLLPLLAPQALPPAAYRPSPRS